MDGRKKKRAPPAHALSLFSDDLLLTLFSFLSPFDLARISTLCNSWNVIVTQSSLWKDIYEKSRKTLIANLTHKDENMESLKFLRREIGAVADWKAQFVKEHHKALVVLGSVLVREWKGHSTRFKMEIIMTGSSDGMVHAWSTRDLHCVESYTVPNKLKVIDLDFDENKVLVVCTTEIYVWNRRKGQLLRHIKANNRPVHSMCYVDPEVFVGCADGTIRVFDLYSGRCSRIFRQHSDRVTCIAAHIHSSLLASGSADGNVHLCDIMTGEKLNCLLPSSPPRGVVCLHVCSEENMLLAGTTTGGVHAWNLRTKQSLWSVRVAPSSITSLHMASYDATTLYVGSINGIITLLDSESGSMLKHCAATRGGKDCVLRKEIQADGPLSFKSFAGDNGLVDVSLDTLLEKIPGEQRLPILCLRVGMTRFVTTHPDGSIRLWRLQF